MSSADSAFSAFTALITFLSLPSAALSTVLIALLSLPAVSLTNVQCIAVAGQQPARQLVRLSVQRPILYLEQTEGQEQQRGKQGETARRSLCVSAVQTAIFRSGRRRFVCHRSGLEPKQQASAFAVFKTELTTLYPDQVGPPLSSLASLFSFHSSLLSLFSPLSSLMKDQVLSAAANCVPRFHPPPPRHLRRPPLLTLASPGTLTLPAAQPNPRRCAQPICAPGTACQHGWIPKVVT